MFRNNVRHATAGRRDARRDIPTGGPDDWLVAVAAELSTPSGKAKRAEDGDRLRAALAGLPPDQRAAVELRHLQGLGVDQVADRLGCTRAGAAGLLRRGRAALRARLTD